MRIQLTQAVTLDESGQRLRPIEMRIVDGVIDSLSERPLPREEGWQVYELGGGLVLPGLVDAHTHLYQSLGAGLYDGLGVNAWLEALIHGYTLSEDEAYDATLLGCVEAIRSGTTCVSEMTEPAFADAAAQAILDSGLRASLAVMVGDQAEGNNPPAMNTHQALAATRSFFERWNGAGWGRLKVLMGPVGLAACTLDLVRGMRALAEELHTQIVTHCAEGPTETEAVRARYGASEVEMLERCGLLGPDCALVHAVWLSERDLQIIANHTGRVVHCPSTNLKIADGIAPAAALLKKGIPVALGCDGAASSGTYDLLKEARLASLLAKGSGMDAAALPAEQVLHMLTDYGAEASGWSGKVGRLAVGYRADLTVLRYPQAHLLGERGLLSRLIHNTAAGDVAAVFVDGSPLLWDGHMVSVDEEALVQRAAGRLRRRDFGPGAYPQKGQPPQAAPQEWAYFSRRTSKND